MDEGPRAPQMSRASSRLGRLLWPPDAPAWLVIGGHLSWLLIVAGIVLVLIPRRWASRVWLIKVARREVVSTVKRLVFLSGQGPFARACAWCGKRGGGGRLTSRAKTPEHLRARAVGCGEVSLSWRMAWAVNPFHEEGYIASWRRVDQGDPDGGGAWTEVPCGENEADTTKHRDGSQWRVTLTSLPDDAPIAFRICAVNRKGRSEWSAEARARTMARPNDEGGGTGPLEGAAGGTYRWTQTQTDVGIRIPLAENVRGKELRIKSTGARLEILHTPLGGDTEDKWLSGNLHSKVVHDEVFWEIDTDEGGRHVAVSMKKAQGMAKWPCLLDGHQKIDVRLVRFFTKDAGFDFYE